MSKKKTRPTIIIPGQKQLIKKPNPQEILSKAGQLKNKFAQLKGQSDQMISDGISDLTNGFLQLIGDTIQYAQQLEAQIEASKKPDVKAEQPVKKK